MTATSPTKKASPAEDGKKTVTKLPTEAPMSPKSIHQAAKDVIETKKAHMKVDPPAAARTAAPSSQLQPMRVKRLSPAATVPTRGSASAAGFDLYASRESVVPARGKAIVATDISIALPAGTYGRIAPRSGLAAKHSIDVGAGVIDVDYRGAVGVILFNFSDADFSIAVGDRIAQLILEEVRMAPALEVDELDETVRGEGGFGSTGGFNGAVGQA